MEGQVEEESNSRAVTILLRSRTRLLVCFLTLPLYIAAVCGRCSAMAAKSAHSCGFILPSIRCSLSTWCVAAVQVAASSFL